MTIPTMPDVELSPEQRDMVDRYNRTIKRWEGRRYVAGLERKARSLVESFGAIDFSFAGPYSEYLDARRIEPFFSPFSTIQDHRHGYNFPFYRSEPELAILRATSRVTLGLNNHAEALLGGLTGFVISTGMTARAVGRKGMGDVKALAVAVQKVIDEFTEEVAPDYSWEEFQQEVFRRCRSDGDCFVRIFDHEGRVELRFVWPEQVTRPPGEDDAHWSFGIETDPEDIAKVTGYNVRALENPGDNEYVPAEEMLHFKVRENAYAGIKRGIPDFTFGSRDALEGAVKLTNNLVTGSALQAAIAYIVQHDTATQDQVQGFRDSEADYTRPRTFQPGVQEGVEVVRPGTRIDVPKGQNYVAPPFGGSTMNYVGIVQLALRSAGQRWNAPEWLVSGDASNMGAYTSSLVAESPFVRRVKAAQLYYQRRFREILLRVVEAAIDSRRLPPGALDGVDLQVEPPMVETRDKDKETARNKSLMEDGIKSPQTIAQEEGLDHDAEQSNFVAIEKAKGPEGGAAGMRGTTEGMAAVQALQAAFYAGELPRQAAVANLTVMLGFSAQDANALLPDVAAKKLTPDATPPALPGGSGGGGGVKPPAPPKPPSPAPGGKAVMESDDDRGDDDGAHLAAWHAHELNLCDAAGHPHAPGQVAAMADDLAPHDYRLSKEAGGDWKAEHARELAESLDLLEAAERAPKDGVSIKGKDYRGGQWIPGSVVAQADDATKAKIAGEKAGKVDARKARGHVDAGKLKASLAEHAGRTLDKHEELSGKRAFNALKQHHGELTLHRVEELVAPLQAAYDRTKDDPDQEGVAHQLGQRLRQYHAMLDHAHAAGITGQVEGAAKGHPVHATLTAARDALPPGEAKDAVARALDNAGSPPAPGDKEADAEYHRDAARELAHAYEDSDDPATHRAMEPVMRAAGLTPVGKAGESVPFDGRDHAAAHDVLPGQPVKVERPGWELRGDGGTLQLARAKVGPAGEKPAGQPKGKPAEAAKPAKAPKATKAPAELAAPGKASDADLDAYTAAADHASTAGGEDSAAHGGKTMDSATADRGAQGVAYLQKLRKGRAVPPDELAQAVAGVGQHSDRKFFADDKQYATHHAIGAELASHLTPEAAAALAKDWGVTDPAKESNPTRRAVAERAGLGKPA